MKLITAIINKDDTALVSRGLTEAGFSMTKLATTGGFLGAGNTTLLLGVDDARVDEAIGVIARYCRQRREVVPANLYADETMMGAFPTEVTIGGATVFVTDVARFEKL